MIRWARRVVYAVILTAGLLAASLAVNSVVNAEGNNQFPGITGAGNEWDFDNVSPDPNLTWQYKDNGPNEILTGNTTHILRNRSIGRNKGTRLRVYYPQRPVQVSIKINVVACDLDAPFDYAGPVRVVLGGQTVYSQGTRAWHKIDHYYEKRDYLTAGSSRTVTQEYEVEGTDRYANSPVCNNYGSYDVPVWADKENCNNPGPGNTCTGNGTETYTLDKTSGTHKVNPPNTALDNRTFTFDFPATGKGGGSWGLDTKTGLWYADLDIDLDARNDPNLVPDSSVMQRITFRVSAPNATNAVNGNAMAARMGYRYFDDLAQASKYFGLEGNGGTDNEYADYGQKFAIPFGMECSSNANTQWGNIILYDPDASPGGYGTSYAAVFRRNPSNGNIIRLGAGDYNIGANANWDGDRVAITAGSNQNSNFSVKMDRGFQYMLAISNPNHAGGGNSATNVWSLYLPTDSINGLINCRFNLEPKISNVNATFNAFGETLKPRGQVVNTEASTSAGEHEWRITRAVFAGKPSDLDRTAIMNSNNNESVCDFVSRRAGNYQTCTAIYTGSYPVDTDKTFDDTIGPRSVGTYVCYMTSVKDPTWETNDDDKWAHSRMLCSVAAKKPRVQFLGSDVRIGGTAESSYFTVGGSAYGSWAEYGVLTGGGNSLLSSGSGLRNGNSGAESTWNRLTFANTPSYGNYTPVPSASSAYAFFRSLPASGGAFNQGNPTAGVYDIGNANIGGNMHVTANGQSIIIRGGNIQINNDIIVDNVDVTSASNLSQVVIVADNIELGVNANRIDAWLVTSPTGSINTCAIGATKLNSSHCPTASSINGPIYTNKLMLRRTAGNNPPNELNQPSESFNLRPDAQLWAYTYANKADYAQTDFVQELPPRY